MRCPEFEPLIRDMKSKHIDKEHYNFNYNGFRFDVILSIANIGYEILVAIHIQNWGCVLEMSNNYNIDVPNDVYFPLREILHLNWSENHFNSVAFLRLLSENSPKKSSCNGVDYRELRNYLPYRQVDEENKIYFCGWNDHIKDKKKAQNFDKTEFYLGKTVADHCRKNNISSLWTDIPQNEKRITMPWESTH